MDSLLSWYQLKIGAYDLQIWERAVEIREQQDVGIKSMDKRSSSVKPELIDIDLVRGSTFSKTKPQYSWLVVSCQALMRVLLLPIFAKWWCQQTSRSITLLFVLIYVLHGVVLSLYLNGTEDEFEDVSLLEVITPCMFMLLVGGIHCHVVSTNFRLNMRNNDSRRLKKKRTLSSALLEPVVSSSQQSTLSLITSSLNNHNGSDITSPKESAENLPAASSVINNNEPSCHTDSRVEPAEEDKEDSPLVNASLEEVEKQILDQHNSVGKKRKPSSSTSNSEPDSSNRDTNIDSTSTDNNEMGDKKRLRHDSLYEELNSTSSGSNSSEGAESETSSSVESSSKGDDKVPKNARAKHFSATVLLPCSSHGGDRIGVRIWESNQCKKVQASLLDIGSIIRRKVQCAYLPHDMLIIGALLSLLIPWVPILYRVTYQQSDSVSLNGSLSYDELVLNFVSNIPSFIIFGDTNLKALFVIYTVAAEKFVFSFSFFLMLSAAHKTFRQRLLCAKYFSHLTSSRRAKKSDIPHFRLDKVENVRLWLSLRSYLRRRGPQRSVDVIVSSAFFLSLVLLCFISLQLLRDSDVYFSSLLCWEMTIWLLAIAIFLLNFMTLGVQINKKYSNTSILLTEQINLYLQMKQKPGKKEELQRVNSVLATAGKLIKEMETPFNIYGLTMNPLLYNITRVVVLSAFSGVVSEMLGFKLKIWKIKP